MVFLTDITNGHPVGIPFSRCRHSNLLAMCDILCEETSKVVCSETTGHRWEHSFGSISGTLKRSKREGTRVWEGSRGCLWAFQRGVALCNGPQQTGALRHVDSAALPLPVDLSTQERPSTSMRTPMWAPEENTHPNYFRKSVVHKKKKNLAGTQPHYNKICL